MALLWHAAGSTASANRRYTIRFDTGFISPLLGRRWKIEYGSALSSWARGGMLPLRLPMDRRQNLLRLIADRKIKALDIPRIGKE